MKRKEIILPAAGIIFTALFYGQLAGINFLLFSILITLLLLMHHPLNVSVPRWWVYCACLNFTALAVATVNSDLSIFVWIITLLVFSNKTYYAGHSILLSGAFGGYSVITSPMWLGIDIHRYFSEKYKPAQEQNKRIVFSILAAVAVALLFLFIYMGANPLFNKFVRTLSLTWLDSGWIFFTVLGILLTYGILFSNKITYLADLDRSTSQDIIMTGQDEKSAWPGISVLATALFALLNIMLLIINYLDLSNMYVAHQLPEGITLSDFVHDAVSALIASIVIGVGLVAWFFNSDLNFNRYGKVARILVSVWIMQNAVIVTNAITRNVWYIQGYQLTHLRIGVYVFLALTLCGLFLTYRKIVGKKSTWWLVTQNVQVWFIVLVFASFFNWDRLVTSYNINRSGSGKKLDLVYLISLSDANLPDLVHLHNTGSLDNNERRLLYKKLLSTYQKNRFTQWPGLSLRQRNSNQSLISLELTK